MMHRFFRLLPVLLISLGLPVAANEVEVDASGETTIPADALPPKTIKKPKTYSPEAIQLASTFPANVLKNENGNGDDDVDDDDDLALKVAAKILSCQKSPNLLERFVREYASTASVLLEDVKTDDPNALLSLMGELVTGIEDADLMFDDITPGALLEQMQQEGFFEGVSPDIMVHYQMNPRKIQDDTKEGLLYEFIAVAQKAGYITIEEPPPVVDQYTMKKRIPVDEQQE